MTTIEEELWFCLRHDKSKRLTSIDHTPFFVFDYEDGFLFKRMKWDFYVKMNEMKVVDEWWQLYVHLANVLNIDLVGVIMILAMESDRLDISTYETISI
jgi:hypothetical protein